MTKNLPAETTPQKIAARDRSAPRRVTGKLRIAVEAMVWEGLQRKAAAERAEMTDHGLRSAMRKPHVLGYYRAELAALREGERARNVHRLVELRDQDENRNAAVKAVQVLEMTDPALMQRQLQQTSPGIVIRILPANAEALRTVEASPIIIEHKPEPILQGDGGSDGDD